jgi:hypothetical protein
MRGNLAGYPARIPHIVGWILGHVQLRPSELATIAVDFCTSERLIGGPQCQ